MNAYLLVFLGGGIGAALRHGVNKAFLALAGANFPAGTLFVNAAGGLIMGLLAGYFALRGSIGEEARLFLTTGIVGGFTTFSAFSLDAVMLWERGQHWLAAAYVAASVGLSIGALVIGLIAARALT